MDEKILIEVGRIVIDTLIKKRMINYNRLRNDAVRKMYDKLKKEGLKPKEAREKIASTPFYTTDGRKYFLSKDSIIHIIYKDENRIA